MYMQVLAGCTCILCRMMRPTIAVVDAQQARMAVRCCKFLRTQLQFLLSHTSLG